VTTSPVAHDAVDALIDETAHLLGTDEGTDAGFDVVVVLDFGSQYSQLITRRIREKGVFSELLPHDVRWDEVAPLNPKGVVLSGGPASVYAPGAPALPPWVLEQGLPVLGICYGLQLLAQAHGGRVAPADRREYGPATLEVVDAEAPLFAGLAPRLDVWMSHGDHVLEPPPGFTVIAASANAPVAAIARDQIIGIQFHPEVAHTPLGGDLIGNFLRAVCGCRSTWNAGSFVDAAVADIRERAGDGRVLLGLSGGVDSAVAAALIHRAIGDRLTPVFVDNGLLRLGEADLVRDVFARAFGMNLASVDARDRFLERLAGVVDPEQKRRLIGDTFVRVFETEAERHGPFEFLAQGTLYPDVIESTTPDTKAAAKIKTHHNVGGLPADMRFTLLEPLKFLFKDEVRAVGRELGLPEEIVGRQPFPGPGLAVRIIGEVTEAELEPLRLADAIVREEIEAAGLGSEVWQAFAVLLPVRTVGVMGDDRTYGRVCAIRAVSSEDAMTADWSRLPHDLLARMSNRIVNEVDGITRVVYDISSKPPATIEWE
jgi:GMP synthase (glutamine-hydrolysing)